MLNTQHNSRKKVILGLAATVILGVSVFVLAQLVATGRFNQKPEAALGNNVDVVIAGAGASGVSAAIQAAREGSSVLLLEETDWIGGQMTTAAVSTMDSGNYIRENGIYGEFITKVKAHYASIGKTIGTCYGYNESHCFEPRVGQQILKQMLASYPGITVRLRTQVISITQKNGAITGVIIKGNTSPVSSQQIINTKIVIDATETGDLLPLSGVAYRSANRTSDDLQAKSSTPACIQDVTYTAVVRKYPTGTMPKNFKMKDPPPGYTPELVSEFAKFVSKDGSATTNVFPWNWALHNSYRGLPDSNNPSNYTATEHSKITKTVINFANDFATNIRYLEDKEYRKTVSCSAKLKTIQFIYYVQTTLGEPDWSVANDEGYDTAFNSNENDCPNIPLEFKDIEHNMPQVAYVRESRRIVGSLTLTAKDIKRSTNFSGAQKRYGDSIAVGDYPNDLHGCNDNSNLESTLESRNDLPVLVSGSVSNYWISGPFQIPLRTLIAPTLKGFLLAEKNISQTRLVNGATRLQPSSMLIGQAVGELAGLANKQNIAPIDVPALDVQRALVANNSILYPYWDANTADKNYDSIQLVSLRGITRGYIDGNFGNNDGLLRDGAAVIITKSFNLPNSTSGQLFEDVPPSYWGYTYINALAASGITGGCQASPPKYCPFDGLTNAQIAVFSLRGWQRLNGAITTTSPSTPTYSDLPSNHWAYPYVEALASNGIKWYCNEATNSFCPDGPTTRGTTANIIESILTKNNVASISAPLIPNPEPTTSKSSKAIVKNSVLQAPVPSSSKISIISLAVTGTPLPTTITTPTGIPLVTTTPTVSASLKEVYFTFARFKYGKYAAPSQIRLGDTLYLKNYDPSKLKLVQIFLYDFEKKGNQEYVATNVTAQSMYVRSKYLLPAGKRYAYVAKFQDRATNVMVTKYFLLYTTPIWMGVSVL